MSFQAFWKDQKRHRMGGTIEPRFMSLNDQRLFDQNTIDVASKNIESHLVFIRLQSIVDQIELEANKNVEKRHLNKLEGLRRRKIKKGSTRRPLLDPVTNLSSRILTDEERAALANGLHHVYPSEQFDQAQFVCNIEYFYARLLNIRTAYQHYERRSANVVVHHELTSSQLHAASQLRTMTNDHPIVITRPGKKRGVVILDRAEYLTKMYAILDPSDALRPTPPCSQKRD